MLKNRFVVFGLFFVILMSLNYYFTKALLPSPDTKNLWFYSGLFMMVFSILFIDPYYSSPKNVITNTIPLALTLIPIKDDFVDQKLWWVSFGSVLFLLVMALLAMWLQDETKSEGHVKNKVAERLRKLSVTFGRGKVLYSLVFIASLLSYYSIQNNFTITLFFFWCAILLIDPKSMTNTFSLKRQNQSNNAIGEVFSIQSKQLLLAKVFKDKTDVNKFDVVEFKYSTQDDNTVSVGFVFDTYFLNNEKWIKVLKLKNGIQQNSLLNPNIIYKVNKAVNQHTDLDIDGFVGIVIEGSNIGNIKFEYSKKNEDLEEGQLLEVMIGSKTIYYQVVEGITAIEHLESKNECGFTCGEAIQLGEWQNNDLSFKKYGWVPNVNTPIFLAKTNFAVNQYAYPEYKLGVIPGTNLPSVINLHDAVSHHMALIGVTGSGKSYLAREIIGQLQTDTKVICIDFTGEYVKELAQLNPVAIIKSDKLPEVEAMIAEKEQEASTSKNKAKLLEHKKKIQNKLSEHVQTFIQSTDSLSIFELPDISNTAFLLEFTQLFLESIFNYAKLNTGERICIVLEEAHTIIPETNFLGDLGDYGSTKALVSKMGQIALQGRKYGVGLLVIAQRTANVSKTVLTQCNTIVCFQAFDETSFNFLSNYIGKDLVQTLPHLKQYHAVVTGKAIKSNLPMIVDLKR